MIKGLHWKYLFQNDQRYISAKELNAVSAPLFVYSSSNLKGNLSITR